MNSEAPSAIRLNQHTDLELRTLETSSQLDPASTSSFQESTTTQPDSSINVQELPPVDAGWGAWTFCLAGLVLETLVWGFGFRYVVP